MRGRVDLGRSADTPELGRGDAEPVEQRVRLCLVVRAHDRVRRRDEHRDVEAFALVGEALQVERRLRQDDVDLLARDDLEHRVDELGVRARGHEVERVAEVPSDGALGEVGADEPDLALAVLAQRAEQRGGARGAGCGDEHGDGPQAQRRNASRLSRSVSDHARRARLSLT